MLAKGADPNLPGGEQSKTPLHEAAHNGSVAIVTLLLDHGADVNAHAIYREELLEIHYAALRGNVEVMKLLRERGTRAWPIEPITISEIANAYPNLSNVMGVGCTPCHTYRPGGIGDRAPSLWNVAGREFATQEGYDYSPAMKSMTGYWDFETLKAYIADNYGSVPGTNSYNGTVRDRTERIAAIAYIRKMADDPVPLELFLTISQR